MNEWKHQGEALRKGPIKEWEKEQLFSQGKCQGKHLGKEVEKEQVRTYKRVAEGTAVIPGERYGVNK